MSINASFCAKIPVEEILTDATGDDLMRSNYHVSHSRVT